jgi:hypothetical protein
MRRDLGRYCFIGAGAVVIRDVPDYALWLAIRRGKLAGCAPAGNASMKRCVALMCGKAYQRGTMGWKNARTMDR